MAIFKQIKIFSSESTDSERAAASKATKFVDTISSPSTVVDPTAGTVSAQEYEAAKVAASLGSVATDGVTGADAAAAEKAGVPILAAPVSDPLAIKAADAITTVAPAVVAPAQDIVLEKSGAFAAPVTGGGGAGVSTKSPVGGTSNTGTNTMEIGMNLAGVSYFGTQYPFLDRFKTSSQWVAQYANGQQSSDIPLNSSGFPAGMPAGAVNLYVGIGLDPVALSMSDVYVITYKGTASINLLGATILSSEPGKIVFRFTGEANATALNVSSMDPANPITEMHVVREDQMALFQSGEIFNPAFIQKASQWSELRYMDWGNTNNNTLTSWDQRTKVTDPSWGMNTQTASVPIEIMVALANKTNTDMWINIPAQADDTYVRNTLAYVRDNLAAGLTVKVEYSNEVWNWGFQQAYYAREQSGRMWGTDLNGNGQIDYNTNEEAEGGSLLYYGYRAAQVAAIASSVFGSSAASRLQNVISTQTVYQGLESYVFRGVQLAGLGSVGSLFQDYALTSYFNFDAVDQATMISWAHNGQAGIDAAFAALGTSLNSLKSIYEYQQAVAARNGLAMVGYEGGLHVAANAYPESEQAAILALFDALSDDPRMGDLYTKMVADFASAGGSGLVPFSDAVAPTKWGNWGTLDSIYDESSPRYDALVAASRAAKAGAAGGGDATQLNVQTSAASYGLTGNQLNLTYTGIGGFNGRGNDLANTIVGGNSFNMLSGGGGDDTLVGGNRNDLIDGGTGADRMVGGNGDDTYTVDNVGDVIVEFASGGTDEVRTTLDTYVLGANVENLTFNGGNAVTGTGNDANNVITASTGAATLYGNGGDDTLIGSAGADRLDGGTGADLMRGGAGNDTYIVDNAGDQVIELAGGGIDTVRTTLNLIGLASQVEDLTFVGTGNFQAFGNTLDNFIIGAAGNDTIWGDAGNDTLYGRGGNDMLIGGTGADLMNGGAGDDRYDVDNVGDTVVEMANQGNDIVYSTISYTLGANVENLQLSGTANLNGTGNELNNQIFGNDGDNILSGGAGVDALLGGAGNDTLYGGDGNDGLSGGAGNDILYGGNGDDSLDGSTGDDVLIGGAGTDYMDGGAGADRYVFYAGDTGRTRATADNIGFSSADGDLIDLSNMDAKTATSGRDAFNFIGQGAFTRTAGELRIQFSGGYWDVTGDTNGDGIADFSITVNAGSTALTSRDFVF